MFLFTKITLSVILLIPLSGLISCGQQQTEPRQWRPQIITAGNSTVFLPDFSFAGYHCGEKALPEAAATHIVTDFGAIPNDGKDDSEALLHAISTLKQSESPVVLRFPAGTFHLNRILAIERSNFVLQGSGSGDNGTVISIATPMRDMPAAPGMEELQKYLKKFDKKVKPGEPFSPFSWTGGIIWPQVMGKQVNAYLPEYDQPLRHLTAVSQGRRGQHTMMANSTDNLKTGQFVDIHWFNKQGKNSELLQHLYGTEPLEIGSRHWENPEKPLVTQTAQISAIEGNRITIREPLLHDLKSNWQTTLSASEKIYEVGIEHLRIEFPEVDYGGHHLEHGYNAIYLTNVVNGWIRNVHFVNADNAILSDACAHVTIEQVTFSGRRAHYPIHLGNVNHMLVRRADINCPAEHSVSFNTRCKASVFTDISIGNTPTLDQHCGSNHQNLFDNFRIVQDQPGANLFQHGGAGYWRPTHGQFNTFWNIKLDFEFENAALDTIMIGNIEDGPSVRMVGITANYPISVNYGPNAYLEGMNQPNITIPSLYEFQLKKRLEK